MDKNISNFFSKLIFSFFFVYIMILGIFNIVIAYNRENVEQVLAYILEAEEVTIGNVSNLPLIFISGTEFKIKVNDELSLTVEGIYIHYRFWHLFSGKIEKILNKLQIDKISFYGHSVEIKKYKNILKNKFSKENDIALLESQLVASNKEIELLEQDSKLVPQQESVSEKKVKTITDNLDFIVNIKEVSIVLNSMTEFWHKIDANRLLLTMDDGIVSWVANTKLNSVWSNSVFLASTDILVEGVLSNMTDIQGRIFTKIEDFNIGGIPIIEKTLSIETTISNNIPVVKLISNADENIILKVENDFSFELTRPINLEYNDYEEYKLLDYAFDPGIWDFKFKLQKKQYWYANISLKSDQYPNYGLNLTVYPLKKNSYGIQIALKTHYFGGINGDLIIEDRPGLYPLPSGSLYLDNVRFILNGLIFSGQAVADAIPNKNEMNISVFDVRMNNGLIGKASAKFEFTPEGIFNIHSMPLMDASLAIKASIGGSVAVTIDAFDVDGDFVAQNIKIPIFGLKDSRYQGQIVITKENRKEPVLLTGWLKGYLDGEEQIDAVLNLEDSVITIERLHLIDQDLLFTGNIDIISERSNTFVNIESMARLNTNDLIPVNVDINVKKKDVIVSGLVDNVIPFTTITKGDLTDLKVNFQQYNLSKLGVEGSLDAQLLMGFSPIGVTRFSIQNGMWNVNNRKIILDFDSFLDEELGKLETTYMRMGLDRDVLDAYGYFTFLESQFGISLRFDRGGSFQFNLGRYIVKSNLDLKNFVIDNIFNFEIFNYVSFLRNAETETVVVSTKINILGSLSDLDIDGTINIEGSDFNTFQLAISEFSRKNNNITVTNMRLRHSLFNTDGDVWIQQNDENLVVKATGAITLGNMAKSEFDIDYINHTNQGRIIYELPNLYFMSKKPMTLNGKIIFSDNDFLFISDSSRQGMVGVLSRVENTNFWDMTFMNESVKLYSDGSISDQNIIAALNMGISLDKLSLIGDVRKIKGQMNINTSIDGELAEPNINGQVELANVDVNLRSLRNRLLVNDSQSIQINNSQIVFPDLSIEVQNGGIFGLDGIFTLRDQGAGETTDLRLYSKNQDPEKLTSLNWNVEIPYLTLKGKTYIDNISLVDTVGDLLLSAYIKTDNFDIRLELDDSIGDLGNSTTVDPVVSVASLLDLDIKVDMENRLRFLNQLFDLEFKQQTPLLIQGNVGDDTVAITGDLNIEKGKVFYLNTDLTVNSGSLSFSGDDGDPYPYLTLNTEASQQSIQDEAVDIYVDFEGKLPNIELASVSSTPTKPRSEILALLGGGLSTGTSVGRTDNTLTPQEFIASGVGVAENVFFTAPLSRRVQRLIPVDTLQFKTDVLGNLTRSVNSGSSGVVTGLSILHGSELEVGQYIPGISGLQVKYNLRLESPNNTSLDSGVLNQIHQGGIEWIQVLPYSWQGGVSANVSGEVTPQTAQQPTPELVIDLSLKKRF